MKHKLFEMPEFKTPRNRRRNCWDRLRLRLLDVQRRRRADPAASAALQLTALFALMFGRMPPPAPATAPYVAPPLSPVQARRNETARRLGIPARYVDLMLSQGTVPYILLFDHIRRGGRCRDDALSVLRQKAPESCRDWLDHISEWGLWSSLLLCHVRDGVDADTDIKLLKSTLAWLEVQNPDMGVLGPADAETALIPTPSDRKPDPDNGPDAPKGRKP